MPPATTSTLLVRARDHADAEAWTRFVSIYAPLLRDWLGRHSVPHHDHDDLVQEVLHAVAQEMPGFVYDREKGSFRGWLRTVLVHRLKNYWRQRRSRPVTANDNDFLVGVLDQLEDAHSDLARLWDHDHDRHVVARLLLLVRGDLMAV